MYANQFLLQSAVLSFPCNAEVTDYNQEIDLISASLTKRKRVISIFSSLEINLFQMIDYYIISFEL